MSFPDLMSNEIKSLRRHCNEWAYHSYSMWIVKKLFIFFFCLDELSLSQHSRSQIHDQDFLQFVLPRSDAKSFFLSQT